MSENVTLNLHHDGVTPDAFTNDLNLSRDYVLCSINADRRGSYFCSTLEACNYPEDGGKGGEDDEPEDWDEEEDGKWEAPTIANPDFKLWTQKKIPNPAYKGVWTAPDIPNPDFKDDAKLYAFKDLAAVGIELWQVKAGSLFDNILVTDDLAAAKKLAADTWAKSKDAEKAAHDAFVAKEAEEAAAKAKEAAKSAPADDGADEEDDEDAGHDEL